VLRHALRGITKINLQMVGYTLVCGHKFSLHDVVSRAIKCENEICHVCKVPFTSNESFFLSFGDPENQTMEEFNFNWDKKQKEREITIKPVKIFCGECEGTTRLGKKCTCSAMKNSKFCRFHKVI